MTARQVSRAKNKLFRTSLLLCVVFGVALFFIGRSYIRLLDSSKSNRHVSKATHLALLGNTRLDNEKNQLYVNTDNYRFNLTLNPALQETAEKLLREYDPVTGAFVLLDADTGAILAMASHSRKRKDLPAYNQYQTWKDPYLRSSIHPMASIAKLITASAALEKNISNPATTYNCGGRYSINGKTAVSDPKGHGHGNISMGHALATSCNPTYARIGIKLGQKNLMEYFEKFMFNTPIDFDLPLMESGAAFGSSEYELARAGSGFDGSWMSPVHATAIVSVFNNDGKMIAPYIIESYSRGGAVKYQAKKREITQPVSRSAARAVSNMMSGSVNTPGATAYKGFHKNGKPIIRGMKFVGKTGSINGNSELDFHTWFVGNAEKNGKKYAIATLIVNGTSWKIKAASYTGQFFSLAASKME